MTAAIEPDEVLGTPSSDGPKPHRAAFPAALYMHIYSETPVTIGTQSSGAHVITIGGYPSTGHIFFEGAKDLKEFSARIDAWLSSGTLCGAKHDDLTCDYPRGHAGAHGTRRQRVDLIAAWDDEGA